MLRQTAAALAVAAWCATAGTISAQVRLADESDRAAFRSWFVLLADAQFERPTDDVQDCAALVRHAVRERFAPTHRNGSADRACPSRRNSPTFDPRRRAGGRWTAALSHHIGHLSQVRGVCRCQDARQLECKAARTRCARAAAGDLLYFRQPGQREPDHLMVFVGRSHFESEATTGSCITPGRSMAVRRSPKGTALDTRCNIQRLDGVRSPRIPASWASSDWPSYEELRLSFFVICLCYSFFPPAASAQDDERPAFSLSTSEVFTTRDAPNFYLTFRRIPQLDFRVYKVKDPFAFFEGLDDPHSLGTAEANVKQERTLLERFADWKREQRQGLRRFARAQASHDYRVTRRAESDKAEVSQRVVLNANTFAQVPLLNADQVVTTWRELLPNNRDTEVRRVPVEIKQPGIYVVEAVHDLLRAYTIVIVSDLGLVTKTSPGQMLFFAADRFSGEPAAIARSTWSSRRRPIADGRRTPMACSKRRCRTSVWKTSSASRNAATRSRPPIRDRGRSASRRKSSRPTSTPTSRSTGRAHGPRQGDPALAPDGYAREVRSSRSRSRRL
jgi:uncharacterized protein YfaT (DUF1175 family)